MSHSIQKLSEGFVLLCIFFYSRSIKNEVVWHGEQRRTIRNGVRGGEICITNHAIALAFGARDLNMVKGDTVEVCPGGEVLNW
jgi:hypothetical protein